MKKYIKISFLGDIMCELPQLKAAKKFNTYNFDTMFNSIKEYLKESDYVVGNLETPISDSNFYTKDLYSFNTPSSFLTSLKRNGINALVTANNHCLDRGINGLNETMVNIKKNDMKYFGTYLDKKEKMSNDMIRIGDIKISFLAYTYGTNYSYNRCCLNEKDEYKINLLKKQRSNEEWPIYNEEDFYNQLKVMKKNYCIYNLKRFVKKLINYKPNYDLNKSIVIDNINEGEWNISDKHLENIYNAITKEKNKSDVVFLLLHTGGQFNSEPGSFTKEVIEKICCNSNPDSIICTHPHVVQNCDIVNNVNVQYSLGNVSISPSTEYLNHTLLPEYSIIYNVFINEETKKIEKYTFRIIKAIEDKKHYLTVNFVDDLIQKEKNVDEKNKLISDSLLIYNRVTNKNKKNIKISKEYIIGDEDE